MAKFKVELCRTYFAFGSIEVEAESAEKARAIALECAEDFSTKDFETEVVSCNKEE